MTSDSHKILCVDDEPRVLEALMRHLRDRFEVLTADCGSAAIDILQQHRDLAIVLSDMRMPEMDGATLLRHARTLQPNAVRLLLTGQADVAAAIKAINEGQIFRFLTKPCPPEQLFAVLDEAVRQYELVIAERVLLQRTVLGSIRALTDIMVLVSPAVVGRAVRSRRRVSAMAQALNVENRWQLEAAALLSHLGHVSLPEPLVCKLSLGLELEVEESKRVADSVSAANRLIAHVPRLEPVSSLLAAAAEGEDVLPAAGPPPDRLALQILKLVIEVERLQSRGLPPDAVMETLETLGNYPRNVLEAWRSSQHQVNDALERAEIPLTLLEAGMILDEDVLTTRNVLIAPRGCEVTVSFIEHIRHFTAELARPSVAVLQPPSAGLMMKQALVP